MNRARCQFLARPALSKYYNRRVSGRYLTNDVIDFLHSRAFAHHIMLDAGINPKTLVLSGKVLQMLNVLDGYRSNGGYGGNRLQMVFIKPDGDVCCVEIDYADYFMKGFERRAKRRIDVKSV